MNIYCLECEDGYIWDNYHQICSLTGDKFYDDLKCSKVENCIMSQDENSCLKCKKFYCLDVKNGKCIDNEEILNEKNKKFFRCKKTNKEGNICEECEEGLCINTKDCVEMKDNNC